MNLGYQSVWTVAREANRASMASNRSNSSTASSSAAPAPAPTPAPSTSTNNQPNPTNAKINDYPSCRSVHIAAAIPPTNAFHTIQYNTTQQPPLHSYQLDIVVQS